MLRPFSLLPTEILDLIAGNSSLQDLLALCRADRSVHAVCLRQIYCDITLPDARSAVLFFRTMISNKLAASYVLNLAMESYLAPELPVYLFKAFGTLVRTGMCNLTSLHELDSTIPQVFHVFSDMHFPHLRACTISLFDDTAAFLRLHPKLTHLIIYNPLGLSVPVSLRTPPIILPDITSFVGPHILAPLILQNSPAALATTLNYHQHDTTAFAETLSPIAKAVPALRVLYSIVPTWDPALPAAIGAHLPSLVNVKIQNRSQVGPDDPADDLPPFLLCIDRMIHALRDLRTLHIVTDPPHPLDRLAVEFEHVRRWGDISPALVLVLLTSHTPWVRLPGGLWLPSGQEKWFVREIACSDTLPPAYLAELQRRCGEETVASLQTHFRALKAAGDVESV
ncbi:hypothetical protein C8R46DRAFT_1351285 [Mycena filopes]|nr:hypothetical protein C8R46DRAFT_1351285 [Mycena filopes]